MKMPPLETDRLRIRPFQMDDFEAIHRILDIELEDAVHDNERLAQARTARRRWLQWISLNPDELAALYQPPYGDRAVVLKESGEVIGVCGYAPVMMPLEQIPYFHTDKSRSPARNVNEFGLYWAISTAHQGQGYATEAGKALIDYAFGSLNLKRIVANTDYDNFASQGVMRKLGMTILRNPEPEPPWMQIIGVLEHE
ncbi:MAG: GNAT family N-acetyltransferase [Caldilineaceae bacterium]|nr:GNAT family N-acetyltransferase [Caldilineaceae bacterium]